MNELHDLLLIELRPLARDTIAPPSLHAPQRYSCEEMGGVGSDVMVLKLSPQAWIGPKKHCLEDIIFLYEQA